MYDIIEVTSSKTLTEFSETLTILITYMTQCNDKSTKLKLQS